MRKDIVHLTNAELVLLRRIGRGEVCLIRGELYYMVDGVQELLFREWNLLRQLVRSGLVVNGRCGAELTSVGRSQLTGESA